MSLRKIKLLVVICAVLTTAACSAVLHQTQASYMVNPGGGNGHSGVSLATSTGPLRETGAVHSSFGLASRLRLMPDAKEVFIGGAVAASIPGDSRVGGFFRLSVAIANLGYVDESFAFGVASPSVDLALRINAGRQSFITVGGTFEYATRLFGADSRPYLGVSVGYGFRTIRQRYTFYSDGSAVPID